MKKNMYRVLATMIVSTCLCADDTYVMKYSQDTNCSLLKNNVSIPLIDPRFGEQKPNFAYTCNSVQKERYNYCRITKSKNTTAMLFAYGPYENTNQIIAFKIPHPSVDSFIEVVCTKELVNNK